MLAAKPKNKGVLRALRSSVHDNFRCEGKENMFEQADCESEACPVMSVFKNLQSISIEFYLAIEIHGIEGLHRNLILSAVLDFICLIFECEVVFDWAPRIFGLFVLARGQSREYSPETDNNWNGCNK